MVLRDKGFHEQRAVAVTAQAVVGQTAQGERERLGGEIAAGGGGSDQEAAQAEHAMQVARASSGIPADEGVAGGQRESGRGEAERAEHAMGGDQQVAQLGPGVEDGSARMLAGDEFVPGAALVLVADLDELQVAHQVDPGGQADRRGHGTVQTARAATLAVVPGRGQVDLAGGFESAQGLHATGDLRLAAGIEESEPGADPPANFGAAGVTSVGHEFPDLDQRCALRQCGRDPMLLIHAPEMAQSDVKSQVSSCVASAACGCRGRWSRAWPCRANPSGPAPSKYVLVMSYSASSTSTSNSVRSVSKSATSSAL